MTRPAAPPLIVIPDPRFVMGTDLFPAGNKSVPITEALAAAALDGGADGLDLVRQLAKVAPAQLKPGGLLALEIGAGQAVETEEILRSAGFVETERHEDLSGIERVVSGRTAR